MLKPAALAVAPLWKFLFGSECPLCKDGRHVERVNFYDGKGSMRTHKRGSVTFDTYESKYCARNGWFMRHRLVTAVIVFAIGFFVIAGINAARAETKLPPGVTCEQVQANYAQWSHLNKSVIRVWLRLNGYSRGQIREAERCLN